MKKTKKDASWSNFYNYYKGKESLKNAVLQHPEEDAGSDSVYNYMKSNTTQTKWIMPFDQYENMGKPKK
mgnify:CR=1 FL=1